MKPILFAGLLLAWLLSACSAKEDGAQHDQNAYVATTFYPLTEFTKALLGEDIPVECPLPAGEDPIFWQPGRAALEVFRAAALVVSNGAEFEKWLGLASLAESRHVRTANGFRERWIQFETTTHSHGAGEHTHSGVDGHTWLDPELAQLQVAALAEALERRFPKLREVLPARAAGLDAQLAALDARLAAVTPRLAGVEFFASHPAYDYLAKHYGWKLRNIEPQDLPASADRPMLMLWEGSPWDDAPERAVHVRFTPAENPDAQEAALGYFAIQARNLDGLERALDELGL